jgi:hypothetical protein
MKTSKQLLAAVLLLTSTTLLAQKKEAEEAPESSPSEEVNGYVITVKGDTLYGKITTWKKEPWWNQKKVKLKTTDGKTEKFKTDEAAEYMADAIGYKVIAYSDNSAIGFNMIKRSYFMEVLTHGRIKAYRFYEMPSPVFVGQLDEHEKELQRIREEWQLLVEKEGGKLTRIADVKGLKKLLGDNKAIIEKFNNGGYGNVKTEGKKGLGKLMRQGMNNKMKDA